MSNKKLLIAVGVLIGGLLLFLLIGKSMGFIGADTALAVTTSKAIPLDITETVSASGKIYPSIEVKISPDVSGEIIELNFAEGDSVYEDDLIVRIRPDIYQSLVDRAEATVNQTKASLASADARLLQVQAQFENAELTFNRNKQLFDQKVISQAEYDNAVAAFKTSDAELEAAKQSVAGSKFSVKSAEAALKEARDNLRQTSIYAPISGVISMLAVEKGERVVGTTQMAGTEMLRIADFTNMEVHVDVTESVITRVHLGDTAEVEVDAYYGRKFMGVVQHIANSAAGSGQLQLSSESVTNFMVKIALLKSSYQELMKELGQSPFKPGMSASVDIFTAREIGATGIPIQSVMVDEEPGKDPQEIVYLFKDGVAEKVAVETGIQDDYFISIKSGVAEGDEVISGPYSTISRLLEDGDPVRKEDPEDKKKKGADPQ